MKISKVYCAYFSPGDTTKKVVTGIGESFKDYPVENINLTDYDMRQNHFRFTENHLLIIGVPVGFVNVEAAKELILEGTVPYIVNKGRKGGSGVAAAICNAALYECAGEADGRKDTDSAVR